MTESTSPAADRAIFSATSAAILVSPLALDIPDPAKLALLGLAFGLTVLAGPIAAMMLVCLSLAVSSSMLVVGSTEWSPLELALVACGASVGFAATLEVMRSRSLRPIARWIGPRDLTFLAGALLVLAVATMTWIADPDLRSDSLRALRRVIIEPLFVIPALTEVRRRSAAFRLVPWLAVPAMGVSILAFVQLALGRSTLDIGGIERPIGTFTHPNNLSFYLERTVLFAPLLALPFARRYGRVAWLPPAVVVAATLATISRGAAIALGVGAAILLWEVLRARWRIYAGLAAIGLLLVFASRYFAESGDSVDARRTIWESAIDMIRDRPLTGIGLDQFLGQYGRRYVRPEGWPERSTSHPHNVVLDFWLSLGIGGLAVLWLLLELCWRRFRASMNRSAWSVERVSVAMIAAGLAHGLIDNSFFLPYLATFTLIGLGLSTVGEATGDG